MAMIQEYLTTNISMNQMTKKYHIGHTTIPKWMRIFCIPMPNKASAQNIMSQDNIEKEKPVSNETLEARLK